MTHLFVDTARARLVLVSPTVRLDIGIVTEHRFNPNDSTARLEVLALHPLMFNGRKIEVSIGLPVDDQYAKIEAAERRGADRERVRIVANLGAWASKGAP